MGREPAESGSLGSPEAGVSHRPLSVLRPTLRVTKLAGKVIRGRDWQMKRSGEVCRTSGVPARELLDLPCRSSSPGASLCGSALPRPSVPSRPVAGPPVFPPTDTEVGSPAEQSSGLLT